MTSYASVIASAPSAMPATTVSALSAITWQSEVKVNGHTTDHYEGQIDGMDFVGCLAIVVAAIVTVAWIGDVVWHGIGFLMARWRERRK